MSKEYGWTDDQIMDLPVVRFRQIVAAIRRRLYLRRREEISLTSWQTRQLASFIAAGYMIDSKKGNPALDAAQVLSFDEIEAAQLEEARAAIPEFDEQGNIIPIIPDNLPSTETAMSVFGNPDRWRAR